VNRIEENAKNLKKSATNLINLPEAIKRKFLDANNNISGSKTGSISMISKGRKDKINNYLETFKMDSVEKKEEHFKSLFSSTGKISTMILEKDSNRYYINISS
jgi:hypothetical protein